MRLKPAMLAVLLALAAMVSAQQAAVAASPPDGESVFRQRCQACHSATPEEPARIGPNLAGVVGRKAATTAFNYSPALRASGVNWTRANLDRFLTGPSRMVPGTRMAVALTDKAQRATLIDYLATRK